MYPNLYLSVNEKIKYKSNKSNISNIIYLPDRDLNELSLPNHLITFLIISTLVRWR